MNGDGYDDVLVGEPYYDNCQTDEGRVHVYLGSASGLNATPAWTIESDQANALLGTHVAAAGDVNSDGYDDIVTGAYRYDNGETDEGRAYVYYGSASGLSATADWTAEGDQAGAAFGIDVAGAGDVNGDGYEDVLIGAQAYDNGETDEGRVYLYYGSAGGLNTTAAWTGESNQAGAAYGWAVAAGGDLDDDGYADFFVGADEYDGTVANAGRVYLFYGGANGPASVADWIYDGTQNNGRFGSAVAGAGDLNGDGTDDFLVGEAYYDSSQGRAHAFYTLPSMQVATVAYEYDALYRLTDAAYAGAITDTFAYDYDPVGNMTAFTETVDAQTTGVARTFDAANRLEYAVDASGTTTYTYDAKGNLVELVGPPTIDQDRRTYTYNQRNLLVEAYHQSGSTIEGPRTEYDYDGDGNRLHQRVYGASPILPLTLDEAITYTNDIIGLTQVLVADDGTDQVVNLYGLDLISQDDGSEVRTLLSDGLGSVRTEMVGAVVETTTTYTPYGEVLEQAGTSGTAYGFTGEQEDDATGLLYLRARYYSPQRKVFQSRDPWQGTGWRPETLNRYVYVGGDPVRFSDPFGLCRTDDPYDPYADTECLEIAAYLARRDPTNGFNTYAQFSTFTLAKRRDELILQDARATGLAAIIEYFRVDGSGSAAVRLHTLLQATNGFEGRRIPLVPTGAQFGLQVPGGPTLHEEFDDQRYYNEYWPSGVSYQMSHFLTAVSFAYYTVNAASTPIFIGGVRLLYGGQAHSDVEIALRLMIGHELVSDREGFEAQYSAADLSHVYDFIEATAYDVAGNECRRDEILLEILHFISCHQKRDRDR